MSGAPIRVLLVEDHAAFRQALALTFAQELDLLVVGQAGTVAAAPGQLRGWTSPSSTWTCPTATAQT